MRNARLKVLATAYNANAEMCSFAIGIGTKWIGSVKLLDDNRIFEARIGPVTGKGLTPDNAARQAWHNFLDYEGNPCGFQQPASREIEQDRITLRTTSAVSFDVLIGGKPRGEVVMLNDGRYRATIEGAEKVGVCAMASARLAWLKKLDGGGDIAS